MLIKILADYINDKNEKFEEWSLMMLTLKFMSVKRQKQQFTLKNQIRILVVVTK